MRRIGIRELRQNASEYIRLVKQGEAVEITERGELVAVLIPPPPEEARPKKSRREELIEQGLLIPGEGDWRDFETLAPKPGDRPLSEILSEMRDEERW